MRYKQGKYIPRNRNKYKGDLSKIFYRSGWEYKFMKWCDATPSITEWGSEEIFIPYVSPLDNKRHKYYPDFYVKVSNKKYIVEVKPLKQTKEPKRRKKVTKGYLQEVFTWGINQAKWSAAEDFCRDYGMEFMIITEKELKV